MAERRMFAKTIIDSDAFLDMPLSAQALYFHLSMRADDDGFVNNPKKIQRMIGASEDDYKILVAKSFVLLFESGVIVIKHWRINNYIRGDRYKETVYTEEKELLSVKDNGAYTLGIPNGNQTVYQVDTQVRLGKDSIGKVSLVEDIPLSGSHDFDKHSNTTNYQYIKESTPFTDEYINYITNHVELDECVTAWMKYKDERKPKSSNHYGETGLIQLLNKIYKQSLEYGTSVIIGVIEDSMSNNYQGIVWDRIKKGQPQANTIDWSKV